MHTIETRHALPNPRNLNSTDTHNVLTNKKLHVQYETHNAIPNLRHFSYSIKTHRVYLTQGIFGTRTETHHALPNAMKFRYRTETNLALPYRYAQYRDPQSTTKPM